MSEPDVSELITVRQAIELIDAASVAPRVIELPLEQSAGLRLAENICADRDYPPFDRSLMDGFAVRCEDVAGAPIELNLIGEIPAGQQATRRLAARETMAIMTGAPLPGNADGVIPIEDTDRIGDSRIGMRVAASPGRYVARRGSDVRAGAIVLEKGTRLDAPQLSVAATVGASRVRVFAKPRAALISTGDEIVPFDQNPGDVQIRNSNAIMLAALLRKLGCEVIDLGIVRDMPAAVREAIGSALVHDLLFITGGMSMGTHDYVPRTLAELGLDLRITKLRIKPGKPFVFGATKNEPPHYVFGLPGNPLAGFVCTIRFASRLIERMKGGMPLTRWIDATLDSPLKANGAREFYLPVVIDGGIVRLLEWKGSADVFTLARANALLVRPENDRAQPAGAHVRAIAL